MIPFRVEFSLVPRGCSPMEGKIGPHTTPTLFDAVYYVSVFVSSRIQASDDYTQERHLAEMAAEGIEPALASSLLYGATRNAFKQQLTQASDPSAVIAWLANYFAAGEDDTEGYLCLTPATPVFADSPDD